MIDLTSTQRILLVFSFSLGTGFLITTLTKSSQKKTPLPIPIVFRGGSIPPCVAMVHYSSEAKRGKLADVHDLKKKGGFHRTFLGKNPLNMFPFL